MGRRIITKKDISTFKALGVMEKPQQLQPDDFKTKLVKCIPAEIVAAFVTVDGIIRTAAQPLTIIYWIIFIILLILTPLYTLRVTTEPGKPPAKIQTLVSTISFIVWVFALGGPFGYLSWYKPLYGALLLPIYTVAIPIIVGR